MFDFVIDYLTSDQYVWPPHDLMKEVKSQQLLHLLGIKLSHLIDWWIPMGVCDCPLTGQQFRWGTTDFLFHVTLMQRPTSSLIVKTSSCHESNTTLFNRVLFIWTSAEIKNNQLLDIDLFCSPWKEVGDPWSSPVRSGPALGSLYIILLYLHVYL